MKDLDVLVIGCPELIPGGIAPPEDGNGSQNGESGEPKTGKPLA